MGDTIKVLMVTAVWGDWHVNALLDVNLPTLLAPGNLPLFTRHHDVTYQIYTRSSDLPRIRTSPAIQEVAKLTKISTVAALPEQDSGDAFVAQHKAWNMASDLARRKGMFVMNLPSDVVFADGSFAHLVDLLAAGKKSIIWAYSRVVSETFVPALRGRYGTNGIAMAVPPREMVELNLHHLHPLTASCFPDSPYFVTHPELILWPVPGEGLLLRVLASVNQLYDPSHFELNENHLLTGDIDFDDIHHVDDSDDLFAVSLAPLSKDFDWYEQDREADPVDIARWWLQFDSPSNPFIAGHHIRWHACEPTESSWRARERGSDLFLSRVAAAREGIRIWRAVRELRCSLAASMIALAVETGIVLRAFPQPSAALVFAPVDKVLECLTEAERKDLLVSDNGRRFLRFLRHHVVFDERLEAPLCERVSAGGTLALTSAAGHRLVVERVGDGVSVNGALVTSDARRAGAHVVYEIEGVLDPDVEKMLGVPA